MVIAEDMLRTSSQNTRLSLPRTQCGWLLLGALMTLGSPVVKSNLSRLMLIWKNAFPRSTKELESETERGDLFTWQVNSWIICFFPSYVLKLENVKAQPIR